MIKLHSINPSTRTVVGEVTITSLQEIQEKIKKAHAVKKQWKKLGAKKRAEMLKPLIAIISSRAQEIAKLISHEMGKPISQSVEECDDTLHYLSAFINDGPTYLDNEITVNEKSPEKSVFHQIVYEPIGVAASIVPWNYPLSNFVWGVIPNLIAGNPVIFKHSEECPLIGKLAEEMMSKLNLPEGVFAEIYGDAAVGEALLDQDINLIWFTGSSKVGQALFEKAGKKQIKSILEMGGSDPAIIFEDVSSQDIGTLVSKIISRRFENCGQVCSATKRLIVQKPLAELLIEKLIHQLSHLKIGDPLDPKTQMGPLVAERQLHLLEAQIEDAIALGAKVLYGGKRPEALSGAYYLPTLLTQIQPTMRVWKEETFGPVLPIVTFDTEEEAIELANDTCYGLSSVIYTADLERAKRVALQLEAGSVDINFGSHWHTSSPFGGYKASGVGREHGRHGFQELCQVKVIAE
jgi:acyl-CoA reductase-like NAD-dependent aldehyde dehydrogenase